MARSRRWWGAAGAAGTGAIACVLLFAGLAAPVSAELESGVSVSTSLWAAGVTRGEASGKAEWRVTGATASALRGQILDRFDTGDGLIGSSEAVAYLDQVSLYVKTVERLWGMQVTVAELPGGAGGILEDTSGLINTGRTSTLPILVTFKLHGRYEAASTAIHPAPEMDAALVQALYYPLGANYTGPVELRHFQFFLGLFSAHGPVLPSGSLFVIRTPAGEVVRYRQSYTSTSGVAGIEGVPQDQLSLSGGGSAAGWAESPQLLIIGVLVFAYLTKATTDRRFRQYRLFHPRSLRKQAKPIGWLHWTTRGLEWGLLVLYFLPSLVDSLGGGGTLFLGGPATWAIAVGALVVAYLLSTTAYARARAVIPKEALRPFGVPEAGVTAEPAGELICGVCMKVIGHGLELLSCECGQTFHETCATSVIDCPYCGRHLIERRGRPVTCVHCSQPFQDDGLLDPLLLRCLHCGRLQRELQVGMSYLIFDVAPRRALLLFKGLLDSGHPGLVLSSTFPGKIRTDYGLEDAQLRRFSESPTDVDDLALTELAGKPLEAITGFVAVSKEAAVFIDGIDLLLKANGFEPVLRFLRKASDLCALHGATFVVVAQAGFFEPAEREGLEDAFDHVQTLL